MTRVSVLLTPADRTKTGGHDGRTMTSSSMTLESIMCIIEMSLMISLALLQWKDTRARRVDVECQQALLRAPSGSAAMYCKCFRACIDARCVAINYALFSGGTALL